MDVVGLVADRLCVVLWFHVCFLVLNGIDGIERVWVDTMFMRLFDERPPDAWPNDVLFDEVKRAYQPLVV